MSAAEKMLPCFHAAGYHNYTLNRPYSKFDVHDMKGLNPVLMKKLQDDAFVRHIPGDAT